MKGYIVGDFTAGRAHFGVYRFSTSTHFATTAKLHKHGLFRRHGALTEVQPRNRCCGSLYLIGSAEARSRSA